MTGKDWNRMLSHFIQWNSPEIFTVNVSPTVIEADCDFSNRVYCGLTRHMSLGFSTNLSYNALWNMTLHCLRVGRREQGVHVPAMPFQCGFKSTVATGGAKV